MVGGDGACAYRQELDGDPWECPHDADAGTEYCPFHRPVDEKDDEAVAEAFLDRVNRTGQRTKEFVGARFGTLDLEHSLIDADDNYPVDLTDSTVTGELRWAFATVRQPLYLDGVDVATETDVDDVDFEEVFGSDETDRDSEEEVAAPDYFDDSFEGGSAFPDVGFDGGADFRGTSFHDVVLLSDATVEGVADFWGVHFDRGVSFEGARLPYGVLFDGAQFGDVVDFEDATVATGAVFERANCVGEFSMTDCEVDGRCTFSHMNFGADASFDGATFDDDVVFEGSTFEGQSHSINLRDVTIRGELSWAFSTVRQPLHIQNAEIGVDTDVDDIDFDEVFEVDADMGDKFEGGSPFPEISFEGGADFRGTTFEKTVLLSGSAVHGVADFWGTEFNRGVSFERTDLEYGALFDGAQFDDVVDFTDAAVGEGIVFERATFAGSFSLARSTVRGDSVFSNAVFEADASFNGVTFDGGVDFTACRFEAAAKFAATTLRGTALFEETRFEGSVAFRPLTDEADHIVVDLRGCHVAGGLLGQPAEGHVVYDLERATVSDVELEGGGEEYPMLWFFRFVNTDFEQFPFSRYRDALHEGNWHLHKTVDDPDPIASGSVTHNQLETTYLKAKNGAVQVGETTTAAKFFVREKGYRRRHHRSRLRDGTNDAPTRLSAAGQWLANAALLVSSGYGERPWRVIGTSSAIVALFAGVFALLMGRQPYGHPAGYLIMSSASFITLVLGGSEHITSEVVRLIAEVEGFVGAFLIALFVFTLTRSIERT